MKNICKILFVSVSAVLLWSCGKDDYGFEADGAEYIMFADTLGVYPVIDNETFKVPVVSTVACDYDRTFAVEVIDKGSNAIENHHYRLKSNTIVIPAGERRADVEVEGFNENIRDTDSLGFILGLVIPEEKQMPVYGSDKRFAVRTKCVLLKICPFDINDFSGYCLLSSTFLVNYSLDGSATRLIWTEPHKTLKNTIVCHDWLYDGYDINLTLNNDDPVEPLVEIPEDQVIADEWSVFGIIYGDNRIRVEGSSVYPAYYNSGQKYLTASMRAYVNTLGGEYGTVGYYYTIMEWVSKEEAHRLIKEDGMIMATTPPDHDLY